MRASAYQYKCFTVGLILYSICVFYVQPALANSGGIYGRSSSGCTVSGCHGDSPGSFNYNALVQRDPGGGAWTSANVTVDSGDSLSLRFLLDYVSGTVAARGGFNMLASGGSISESSGTIDQSGSELTHNTPQTLTGNDVIFSPISWTTSSSGIFTIQACGQPVNLASGSDGDGPDDCDSMTITVRPVVTGWSGTAAYTENASNTYIVIDSAIALSGSTTLNRAEISLTNQQTDDQLACPATGTSGITCTLNGAANLVTLSGTTSSTNYDTAIQGVRFRNVSQDPTASPTRTVTARVRDSANVWSSTVSKSVTVTPVNDAPTISGVDGTLNYNENDPATTVEATITLNDVDDTDLNRAEVEISTSCVLAEDRLEVASATCTANSITCTQTDDCTLTLTGTRPISSYDTVLQAITYRNISSNPDVNPKTIRYRIRDINNSYSGYDTKTITVVADSDAPTITGVDGTLSYDENDPATTVDGTIALADVDSTLLNRAEAEISGNCSLTEDRLEVSAAVCMANGVTCTQTNNCTLTLTTTQILANYEAVLEAITYRNISDAPSVLSRTLRIRVRDDANVYSAYDTKTIDVNALNDIPDAIDDTFSVAVNSTDNQLDVLLNDTDIDPGDTLTIMSVGTPSGGGSVVIGSPCANNTLCYSPAVDAVAGETFTYTIQDSGGLQDTATVSVDPSDTDGDGIIDFADNCPADSNADQANNDADAQGDLCDLDDNNDGAFDGYITFSVDQGGDIGSFIFQTDGVVNITATLSETSAGTVPSYDWSGSASALINIATITTNNFDFDPALVAPGMYLLDVVASDSGSSTHNSIVLDIQAAMPAFDCDGDGDATGDSTDCDGDGTSNVLEAFQDMDNDGIPDYLDSLDDPMTESDNLPDQTGNPAATNNLMVDTGLQIRLGNTARYAGRRGAFIAAADVQNFAGTAGAAVSNGVDTYTNIGGIYDFEITGLNAAGDSARVVIPLSAQILANAEYRKYTASGGWATFVVDATDSIASAASIMGLCPGPGNASYVAGLQPFHDCIQLTIRDGGANDSDREANGVIRDPGGVGVLNVLPVADNPVVDDGGGAVDLWLLFIVFLYVALMMYGKAYRK